MGKFDMQGRFDEMMQLVSDTRQDLADGRTITADRELAILYDKMRITYQHLAEHWTEKPAG